MLTTKYVLYMEKVINITLVYESRERYNSNGLDGI